MCRRLASRSRRLDPVTRLWDDKNRGPYMDSRTPYVRRHIFTNPVRLRLANSPLLNWFKSLRTALQYIGETNKQRNHHRCRQFCCVSELYNTTLHGRQPTQA